MKKPSELTDNDIIKQREIDPYLALANSRANNLSKNSEYAELMLCKKSFIRLLKSKVSNENDREFIEGYNKYTERLSCIIHALKYNLEWSQKCIIGKDEEIKNLRAYIESKDTIKDQRIALLRETIQLTEELYDYTKDENAGLLEEITLLKANPDRRKGGTASYFGKLCVVN